MSTETDDVHPAAAFDSDPPTDDLPTSSPSLARELSWADYIDLLKPAGDLAQIIWDPSSAQMRAELHRQILMNLSLGYFIHFQSDEDHPDWAPLYNSVFMLQPNPDDTYLIAPVNSKGTYRISGERGTVHILTFTTNYEAPGTSERIGGALGQYDADTLTINDDGHFEVLLSTDRPERYSGDWWYLHPDTQTIWARQRSYDWRNERDGRFAIERIDSPGHLLKRRMQKEEINRKIRELMEFSGRMSRILLEYQNTVRKRGLVNQTEITLFGGAVPVQKYWQGIYELSAHEALILETDIPEKVRYWNVQLNDELWNAVEFNCRQSSLNAHQALLDKDGRFRAVISVSDPGVPNWLDTGGCHYGMIIGRWYEATSHPTPTIKRVALKAIRDYLPEETLHVDASQRAQSLRDRRIGGQLRRRW